MWATTVISPFPCRPSYAAAVTTHPPRPLPPVVPVLPPLDSGKKCPACYSPSYDFNFRPLKLKKLLVLGFSRASSSSSFFDYPLASRIVVKNLPYSVGESALLKVFSNFGHIAEVRLVKDDKTRISKGYAFIQYTCQDEAVLALENMDRKKLEGRLIYVELARPGKQAFQGAPRTHGPPDPTGELLQKNDEGME